MNKITVKYDHQERQVVEYCLRDQLQQKLHGTDRNSKSEASLIFQLFIYFAENPAKISVQNFSKKLAYHEADMLLKVLQNTALKDPYMEALRNRILIQIDKML